MSMVRRMPLAALATEIFRTTLLALVGFAILRYAATKWNIPGLRDALGHGGVAQ